MRPDENADVMEAVPQREADADVVNDMPERVTAEAAPNREVAKSLLLTDDADCHHRDRARSTCIS